MRSTPEDTDRRGVWLRHDIRETAQRLGSVFLVGRASSQDVTVAVTLFFRFRKKFGRGNEEDEEEGDEDDDEASWGFGKLDAARVSSVSFLSIRALSVSHMKVLASAAPSRSLPSPGRRRPFPVVPSKTPSDPIDMEMEMEMEVAEPMFHQVAPALDIIPQ